VAQRDNSPDHLLFIAYTADHHGEPTASMEVAELAWVTSADGNLVTDAAQQLTTTLVQLEIID